MQVRERAEDLAALGACAVAVGFSPTEPLAALADHLEWPWPFLSDVERVVYRQLGFPVVGARQVWNRGTLAIYRRALTSGRRVDKPVEDTRQLGGDAVVAGGAVVALFPTEGPDGRVPVEELVAAVARHAEGGDATSAPPTQG